MPWGLKDCIAKRGSTSNLQRKQTLPVLHQGQLPGCCRAAPPQTQTHDHHHYYSHHRGCLRNACGVLTVLCVLVLVGVSFLGVTEWALLGGKHATLILSTSTVTVLEKSASPPCDFNSSQTLPNVGDLSSKGLQNTHLETSGGRIAQVHVQPSTPVGAVGVQDTTTAAGEQDPSSLKRRGKVPKGSEGCSGNVPEGQGAVVESESNNGKGGGGADMGRQRYEAGVETSAQVVQSVSDTSSTTTVSLSTRVTMDRSKYTPEQVAAAEALALALQDSQINTTQEQVLRNFIGGVGEEHREVKRESPEAKKLRLEACQYMGFNTTEYEPDVDETFEAIRDWDTKSVFTPELCKPFLKEGVKRIAIVGNGPLRDDQRPLIESADVVLRFNFLNNWKRLAERIDIWAVRYAWDARYHYWGFGQMSFLQAMRTVSKIDTLWLVGGTEYEVQGITQAFPNLRKPPVLLLGMPWLLYYVRQFNMTSFVNVAPSTGWMGITAVLNCAPKGTQIDVFGMNWSQQHWGAHKVDKERDLVMQLQSEGALHVHPTACDGLRTCGAEDTTDCFTTRNGTVRCPNPKDNKAAALAKHHLEARLKSIHKEQKAKTEEMRIMHAKARASADSHPVAIDSVVADLLHVGQSSDPDVADGVIGETLKPQTHAPHDKGQWEHFFEQVVAEHDFGN